MSRHGDSGLAYSDKLTREKDRDEALRRPRQSMGGPRDTLTTTNLDGRWVVKEIVLQGVEVRFRHDLSAGTVDTGNRKLNVTWLPIFRHDGTGTNTAMSLEYDEGDVVSANEIGLRLRSLGRTVDDDHPVTVAAFFQKAEVPW